MTQTESKFLYTDLSEKILGCAFRVFRKLGYGHPEKIYQKCLAIEFEKSKLTFEKEKHSKIDYDGIAVGRYYLDFLVNAKIAVELKVRRQIYDTDWIQLLNYLKATNLKVGLLIVFTKSGLEIKRVVN